MQDIGIESPIKYRLLEMERAVRRTLDRVKGHRFKSPYEEEIKQTIEYILTEFSYSLEKWSNEVIGLKQESAARFVDYVRINLDLLLGMIEDILSQEAVTELYYFLDFYLDILLGEKILENRPKILITKGYELKTYLFPQSEDLWVIEVPAKIESNVFEWPTLLHELAHIVENKLKIVDEVFKRSYIPKDVESGTVDVMDYFHCKEYLCDYIALLLCGPIWLFILYDLYLLPTYRLPKTHPEWINRVIVLKEKISFDLRDLRQKIFTYDFMPLSKEDKERLARFIDNVEQLKLEEPQLKPIYRRPPLLDSILNSVESKLTNFRFKFDLEDVANSISNLVRFKPYISKKVYIVRREEGRLECGDIDINIIINAGYLIYRCNIFSQEIKEYFGLDEYRMKSEFMYLVTECIRSARIAMLAGQALLS
ncbi:MAG: hypothetical protein LM601_08755 [Candidatus Verstraetearchaeota archaeon]|nr:hypothetical protein [Candidatus Verstraetearchaeota archaeon]